MHITYPNTLGLSSHTLPETPIADSCLPLGGSAGAARGEPSDRDRADTRPGRGRAACRLGRQGVLSGEPDQLDAGGPGEREARRRGRRLGGAIRRLRQAAVAIAAARAGDPVVLHARAARSRHPGAGPRARAEREHDTPLRADPAGDGAARALPAQPPLPAPAAPAGAADHRLLLRPEGSGVVVAVEEAFERRVVVDVRFGADVAAGRDRDEFTRRALAHRAEV